MLRWLSAIDLPQRVILACADAPLPPIPADTAGVKLQGCVLGLGIELPVQLLAWGVGEVQVVPCPADVVATAELVESWRAVLDGVVVATSAPVKRRRFRPGPVFDLARPVLPRRLAFGLRTGSGRPLDLDLDEPARALAALRILHGQGRARLPSPEATREPATAARQVAVGLEAAGCTACGVCVRACPSGALELVASDGVTVLRHAADRCRGHRSCIALCPQQALTVVAEWTTLDLASLGTAELARVETSECGRCGALHPAVEGALCPACAFRATSAFGSRLPPGYSSQ